ncbi:Putative phage-encoded peptidoglycan binding protein [hydrothermal vent metagenome]|uniref:Phage-encoded peptidoglycan binding protein n=1 Tax=hydrothermal vent metagenome TaxID=652676 RepID=A0A3B0WX40_9ZZZZ
MPPGIKNEPYSLEVSRKLVEADYDRAAKELGVDVASIKAVAQVESRGSGFLGDGRVKILYEGHKFSKATDRQYDKTHPTISYKGLTSKYYKGNEGEYSRYKMASSLNEEAAMESSSWGKFQIMGFNYKAAGYSTVQKFVNAMHVSESNHLDAFVSFIKTTGLDIPLKSRSWTEFAKRYNGKKYVTIQHNRSLHPIFSE